MIQHFLSQVRHFVVVWFGLVYLGECVPTRVCGAAYTPDHAPCGAINHSRRIGQSKEKPYEIRTPRVDY